MAHPPIETTEVTSQYPSGIVPNDLAINRDITEGAGPWMQQQSGTGTLSCLQTAPAADQLGAVNHHTEPAHSPYAFETRFILVKIWDASSRAKVDTVSGKLEVLNPEEKVVVSPIESTSRPGGSGGRRDSAGKKYYTPTKQIALCAVKPLPESHTKDVTESMMPGKSNTSTPSKYMPTKLEEKGTTKSPSHSIPNHGKDNLSDSGDEDDKGRAPTELFAEFLKAVMDQDYKQAQKLCQMILIYEPENPEAKEFTPLIEKMLQREDEQCTGDEDSEETDDSSESEESSDGTSDSNEEDTDN